MKGILKGIEREIKDISNKLDHDFLLTKTRKNNLLEKLALLLEKAQRLGEIDAREQKTKETDN